MPKPLYVPLVDACRVAGLGYRAMWELAVSGKVDSQRDGREWKVSRTDAERVRRERAESETTGAGR